MSLGTHALNVAEHFGLVHFMQTRVMAGRTLCCINSYKTGDEHLNRIFSQCTIFYSSGQLKPFGNYNAWGIHRNRAYVALSQCTIAALVKIAFSVNTIVLLILLAIAIKYTPQIFRTEFDQIISTSETARQNGFWPSS